MHPRGRTLPRHSPSASCGWPSRLAVPWRFAGDVFGGLIAVQVEGHGCHHQVAELDGADNSGLFWFFAPSNWEVLVKILDGCSVNGHYWLLGFGATNVAVDLRVVDQLSGREWRLANPSDQTMGTFADVETFPCGD